MRVSNFGLSIVPNRALAGYYNRMAHDERFKVALTNFSYRRGLCILTIQGVEIGRFILPPNGKETVIETKPETQKQFVFLKERTPEADEAGIVSGNLSNGVINGQFFLEAEEPEPVMRFASASAAPYAKGGVGLTGHSDQQFRLVKSFDVDYGTETMITITLVHDSNLDIKNPTYMPLT